MAFEIERKFLVQNESWRPFAGRATLIRQAYLSRNGAMSLRIRIKDNARATLTIKSAASEIRRLEFEYEIPLADASKLIDLRQGGLIEKLRYELPQDGLTWEIDVFQGESQGLIIAEIELPCEDKAFRRPQWLGPEITSDTRYSNASLALAPFRTWQERLIK
jgi:adenylate cyclase